MTQTYEQVTYEHPEFFWADYGYSRTTTSGAGPVQIELEPKLAEPMDSIIRKQQELDATVEAILASVPSGSDYEKALFVHDYLVQTTEYDSATFALIQNSPDQSIMHDASTAYGCLVNHEAVCEGYAKAYQLLLNRLGIEVGRVSGVAGGGSHTWNYIVLDGEYYYVDVTWDDPVAADGSAPQTDDISHAYFCVTTDALLLDHSIGPDNRFVPECTAVAYEYYRHNGLFLEQFTLSSVEELLKTRMIDNSIQIEFGSPSELQEAVKQLFENKGIFDIPFVRENYNTVWHSVSSSERVLTITLGDN